jgi:hypothetical protein
VASQLGKFVQQFAIGLHQYLDDWLTNQSSFLATRAHMDIIVQLTQSLGWVINQKKSALLPTQQFLYVGVFYDLHLGLMFPPVERFKALQTEIGKAVEQSHFPLQKWQSILGSIQSMADQVPLGRLHVRPLVRWLNRSVRDRHNPQEMILLPSKMIPQLVWWSDEKVVRQGVCLTVVNPMWELTSDSSIAHWGAHLAPLEQQLSLDTRRVKEPNQQFTLSSRWSTRGDWTAEFLGLHINAKELLAVHRALLQFLPQLSGSGVRVMTDNKTVVALIKNQGTVRSEGLHQITTDLLLWTQKHQITLMPHYLPGRLNTLADRLSRPNQVIATEWALKQSVVDEIFNQLGRPDLDLFANRGNCKLPTFVGSERDPTAFASDAMSLDWKGMFAFAFPPTPLLLAIMQKMMQTKCTMLLVAPYWPRMPWFPMVAKLAIGVPMPLPPLPDLLSQVLGNGRLVFHPNPLVLKLHAWKVSNPL